MQFHPDTGCINRLLFLEISYDFWKLQIIIES